MQISPRGLQIIRDNEVLKLIAYLDDKYGKVWTLGYGHIHNVKPGDTCTEAQAEAWLLEDVAPVVADLNMQPDWNLNQNEFDALCSFIFNIGTGAFFGAPGIKPSTMCLMLEANARRSIVAQQFNRWIYDNGVLMNGLVKRRAREKALFLEPV